MNKSKAIDMLRAIAGGQEIESIPEKLIEIAYLLEREEKNPFAVLEPAMASVLKRVLVETDVPVEDSEYARTYTLIDDEDGGGLDSVKAEYLTDPRHKDCALTFQRVYAGHCVSLPLSVEQMDQAAAIILHERIAQEREWQEREADWQSLAIMAEEDEEGLGQTTYTYEPYPPDDETEEERIDRLSSDERPWYEKR